MTINITQTASIDLPKVPDHVRLAGSKKATIDVAALTDESVESLCSEWTVKFRENVESRRKARAADGPSDIPRLGGESEGVE